MKTLTLEEVTPITSSLNVYVWNIAWTFLNDTIDWKTIEKVNKKLFGVNDNKTDFLSSVFFIKRNFHININTI